MTILKPENDELCLVITKSTFEISERKLTEPEILQCVVTDGSVQTVSCIGCVGFLKLFAGSTSGLSRWVGETVIAGHYIVVITHRAVDGHLRGADVCRLTKTFIQPVYRNAFVVTDDEKKLEAEYLSRMSHFFEDYGTFYFSHRTDLLTATQIQDSQATDQLALPLWQRVDKRFFWNHFATAPLRERSLHRWILPIMDAFFHQERIAGALGSPVEYTLVSRRSSLCIGARYLARGIDRFGNVANFVETEQVVATRDLSS
jgi:hypothetical protein